MSISRGTGVLIPMFVLLLRSILLCHVVHFTGFEKHDLLTSLNVKSNRKHASCLIS